MAEKIAILVVGMHRSGTSALARTISLLGARLPSDLVGPNDGNPLGHWEPSGIVALNDRMLADAGSDVYGTVDVPASWLQSPRVEQFISEAVEILKASFADDPLIVIKDPRVALMLPIWHKALSLLHYRCVHVLPLRDPEEVADSLRRRHLKELPYDAWQRPRGQTVWLRYTLASVLGTRTHTRCFLNYADLLRDWRSAMDRLAHDLGFQWPRSHATAAREIDEFLHDNSLTSAAIETAEVDLATLPEKSFSKLATTLYAILAAERDNEPKINAIAAEFGRRVASASELILGYEGLYAVVWQQYQRAQELEGKHREASTRVSGMTNAIQQLWSSLTQASADHAVVMQELGSKNERVITLEAALDHMGKVLAQSNEHRDKFFKELGETTYRAEAAAEAAQVEIEALRHNLEALRASTSWRITAPLRRVVGWLRA